MLIEVNRSMATEHAARTPVGRCNHPSAVLVDPTDKELRELEVMLATCPNCSKWAHGNGPIMAVIATHPIELSEEATQIL